MEIEFEKPIATLEKKLEDLRDLANRDGVDLSKEITALEKKVDQLIDEIFSSLSPWQKVQLSRHSNRPYTRDYIESIFPDFRELHGDRCFGDDPAIIAGIATWPPADPKKTSKTPKKDRQPIMIIGQQKGRSTKQKMFRNFGMAKPEGYRKAIRLMELANRAKMPVLTFIDTPGAYPGIETEERGQAQAIAESITHMFTLEVPVCSVVIGEGGSGGALAIGVGNVVLMQKYGTYSVISPEGCASILWSDARMASTASDCLKMNPNHLKDLSVIDGIIPEPKGGAHRNWEEAFSLMRKSLIKEFDPLTRKQCKQNHKANRLKKFRAMGTKQLVEFEEKSGDE